MRKLLTFILLALFCATNAQAAVRDDNSVTRQKSSENIQRSTTVIPGRSAANANKSRNQSNISVRNINVNTVAAKPQKNTVSRNASTKKTVARAAATTATVTTTDTQIGAAYEQCKSAYFTCMDQFCALKNDSYRRCSCSDRIYDLEETQSLMQDASTELTAFNESLDSVKMTAAQATSMKTASEGEAALTEDASASKALLQAIMNSIKGEDTTVGGKYSSLNTINLEFDTTNAFGMVDKGQAIAAYNGNDLYNAIYGQCRDAVSADCTDATLQRAITAYLMSVEQDCNTVETSLAETKKKMQSSVRESEAMLNLARVENRQGHNADDMAICLTNIETAILNEEVCGEGYKKCLDNGEFIDITTGAPIEGVANFYELGKLLTFDEEKDIADQKLSKISGNKTFVTGFETRVKKFAQPAMDKCVEKSDDVWTDYLDRALLDIYYAQKSKVDEIKQGCFDLVSACYTDGEDSITAAMSELTGDSLTMLQANKIALNSAICDEYVESCSNMFSAAVISEYIAKVEDTDTLTACRTIVQDCFQDFGSTSYENFYYPFSGLFDVGQAFDWFTLCADESCSSYVSECAKELAKVDTCSSKAMMKKAFGGFDYNIGNTITEYGLYTDVTTSVPDGFSEYEIRSTGVATEIYNQILDILSTQCENVLGRFTQPQFLKSNMYNPANICQATFTNNSSSGNAGEYNDLVNLYGVGPNENMCPEDYEKDVDIQSWGACLCWENGARRSLNGTSAKCVGEIPLMNESIISPYACSATLANSANSSIQYWDPVIHPTWYWCTQRMISTDDQVCPILSTGLDTDGNCYWPNNELILSKIPGGI